MNIQVRHSARTLATAPLIVDYWGSHCRSPPPSAIRTCSRLPRPRLLPCLRLADQRTPEMSIAANRCGFPQTSLIARRHSIERPRLDHPALRQSSDQGRQRQTSTRGTYSRKHTRASTCYEINRLTTRAMSTNIHTALSQRHQCLHEDGLGAGSTRQQAPCPRAPQNLAHWPFPSEVLPPSKVSAAIGPSFTSSDTQWAQLADLKARGLCLQQETRGTRRPMKDVHYPHAGSVMNACAALCLERRDKTACSRADTGTH